MPNYRFEFFNFLIERYGVDKEKLDKAKTIMIKNNISGERLLHLLENCSN